MIYYFNLDSYKYGNREMLMAGWGKEEGKGGRTDKGGTDISYMQIHQLDIKLDLTDPGSPSYLTRDLGRKLGVTE